MMTIRNLDLPVLHPNGDFMLVSWSDF